MKAQAKPLVSVVVIEFNMAREIPRTIRSLSPLMQRGIESEQYELILVDNGSSCPSDKEQLRSMGGHLCVHRVEYAPASPAQALNEGIALARGSLIGVIIDGARLASPGLLAAALGASHQYSRPIISPLGFHLGPEGQNSSIKKGYNQQVEDELLNDVRWFEDGYRLFEISVVAPGQAGGWHRPLSESTALFMPRALWSELGGYDERFACSGGGLLTLDTYARACELPGVQPVMLLGEATFHQVHGGTATNSSVHPWEEFHNEYVTIRGKPFSKPRYLPAFYGDLSRLPSASRADAQNRGLSAMSKPEVTSDPDTGVRIIGKPITYRDGAEDELLTVMRNSSDRSPRSDELASHIHNWPTRYHLSRMRNNLLSPLVIPQDARVLDVGAGTGVFARALGEQGCKVVALEGALDRARVAATRCAGLKNVEIVCGPLSALGDEKFDVVLCVGVLEWVATQTAERTTHKSFIKNLRDVTSDHGSLVLAIENQIGLKYLLGYAEDHRPFAWLGLEGYPGALSRGVQTFSRRQLRAHLAENGFPIQHWLYPFPDYKFPKIILDESIYREERVTDIVDQLVSSPSRGSRRPTLLVDDRAAHRTFLDAGLGEEVANSFLVVARGSQRSSSIVGEGLAWMHSTDRASKWQRDRIVVRAGNGLRIVQRLESEVTLVKTSWLSQRRHTDEQFHRGVTLEQQLLTACGDADMRGITDILGRWYAYLCAAASISENGSAPTPFGALCDEWQLPPNMLDVNLDNFLDADGQLKMVDTEWEVDGGVALDLAVLRGLWYTARRLIEGGHVIPWPSNVTIAELVQKLAGLAQFPFDRAQLNRLLDAEAQLHTLVLTGGFDDSYCRTRRGMLSLVAQKSRSALGVSADVPFTRLRDELTHSRRREAALKSKLQQLRARNKEVVNQVEVVKKRTLRPLTSLRHYLGRRVTHAARAALPYYYWAVPASFRARFPARLRKTFKARLKLDPKRGPRKPTDGRPCDRSKTKKSDSGAKLSVPAHLRRGALRKDEKASIASGVALLDIMEGVAPIRGASILDFGCGVKVTQALIERGVPQRKYVGLDVFSDMIDFLKSSCKDARFEFCTVNFQNDNYNPDGVRMTPQSRLPIPDQCFDFITLFSVITHMTPDDAFSVLSVLKRYAHPKTRLIFSCFVYPAQEQEFCDFDPARPLFKACYRKDVMERIVTNAGWRIVEDCEPIENVIAHYYICSPT